MNRGVPMIDRSYTTTTAIEELRAHLEMLLLKSNFDLRNPEIIKISTELDQLITDNMQTRYPKYVSQEQCKKRYTDL